HGEAVAIGMICASHLAELVGRIDAEVSHRQQKLLASFDLPTLAPQLDEQQLLSAMQRDKKAEHGRLRFVLPDRIGHVALVEGIDMGHLQEAWERSRTAR